MLKLGVNAEKELALMRNYWCEWLGISVKDKEVNGVNDETLV